MPLSSPIIYSQTNLEVRGVAGSPNGGVPPAGRREREKERWQGHGDSNPGLMAENHLSWASRRWPRKGSQKYQKAPGVSTGRGPRKGRTEGLPV